MKEVWRPIPGYEGELEASDQGRIRSLDREIRTRAGSVLKLKGKIKKLTDDRKGYLRFGHSTYNKTEQVYVHRAVMAAFRGPSDLQVDHRNRDPSDNRLVNLRYATRRDNSRNKRGQDNYHNVECYNKLKNKWRFRTTVNGLRVSKYGFDSAKEAFEAFLKFEAKQR